MDASQAHQARVTEPLKPGICKQMASIGPLQLCCLANNSMNGTPMYFGHILLEISARVHPSMALSEFQNSTGCIVRHLYQDQCGSKSPVSCTETQPSAQVTARCPPAPQENFPQDDTVSTLSALQPKTQSIPLPPPHTHRTLARSHLGHIHVLRSVQEWQRLQPAVPGMDAAVQHHGLSPAVQAKGQPTWCELMLLAVSYGCDWCSHCKELVCIDCLCVV
jgi:hypothetical protein